MTKVLFTFALMASLLAFMPTGLNAAPASNPLAVPIIGSAGTGGSTANFVGTFNPTGFAVQNGKLVALGTVTGTVTQFVKGVTTVTSILQTVTAPVTATSASCPILHLVIGPISLNVLGLVITTNQIVVDITAQSGTGDLLGNLLCQVANLLNNPNQTLADLLNQILTILRGL